MTRSDLAEKSTSATRAAASLAGAFFDLVCSSRVATGVLVDDVAGGGCFGPASVAVGVAGDVGQDVRDVPAREQARSSGIVVGEAGDQPHEPILRVADVGEVFSGLADDSSTAGTLPAARRVDLSPVTAVADEAEEFDDRARPGSR